MKKGVGVVYIVTNLFVIVFRRNKDIAAFLDEKEKMEEGILIEILSSDDSEESFDFVFLIFEEEV